MKGRAALPLVALLLLCLVVSAGAEDAAKEEMTRRLLGGWLSDDYRMYIRLEDDGIESRITQVDGDYVWELKGYCDMEENCFRCMQCIHYRQFIDWDTMELVEEDWSLNDLAFADFRFGDDGDTLTGVDIPYIDEPTVFHRASDEEIFGN